MSVDCSDVVDVENDSDGMYTIYPAGSNMPTRVYCEIRNHTNGRVAYTVIQQRVDETVDFHRNWKEYRYLVKKLIYQVLFDVNSLWCSTCILRCVTI